MAWVIGIDEAGYGPNLGPLVATAVALQVPEPDADCWQLLAAAVRRAAGKDDGRLTVDDSKLVHAGPKGLSRLERGVFAGLFGGAGPQIGRAACREGVT